MKERPTARVVLLDAQDRVLLIEIDDPTVVNLDDPQETRGPCWITPGGGVLDGERHEDAARRELWEETGIEAARLGPWVWTREARLSFGGEPLLCRERFYLARVEAAAFSHRNLTDEQERAVYRGHRWWTAAELRASRDRFSPRDLPALVTRLVAGDAPNEPLTIR